MAGNVYVSGQLKDKPGKQYHVDAEVEVRRDQKRFVSRGGRKLEGALQDFELDVNGYHVLDIGASTGGFTDCLLREGAKKVWALDVGKGQLDWNLRQDERVIPIEGKNARYLEPEEIGKKVDLVTIDVSFISLKKIIPSAIPVLKDGGKLLTLVKPQFEAGPERVENGGVVTDPDVHREVIREINKAASRNGLKAIGCTHSPIQGKSEKNIEYFLLMARAGNELEPGAIKLAVESAHRDFS